jgi:hypothetical protein
MKTLLFVIALLLIAVPCMAQANLSFSWDAHGQAAQITGFKLYQSITSGTYGSTPVATFAGGTITTGSIPRPTLIGKYYYVLTAYASGMESAYSNEVNFTVGITPPTGLKNPILVAIGKVISFFAGLFGHKTAAPNLTLVG